MAIDKAASILLIGPMSARWVTGLSVAFTMLIEEMERRSRDFKYIDTSRGTSASRAGVFAWRRALATFAFVREAWHASKGCETVYFTIGASSLGFLRDMLILRIARARKARSVLHFHGGGFDEFYQTRGRAFRWLIRRELGHASTIIVLGETLKQQFSFLGTEVCKRIVVVPNGLPCELDAEVQPKQLPRAAEPLELIYLSNMIKSKGYSVLLDAVHRLRQMVNRPIRCHFCGEFMTTGVARDAGDPEANRGHFFDQIRRLELDDIVVYHGLVKAGIKKELLRSSHVFVLPTEYPGEGQPISIIEALGAGMPVVSTRYRGIPEIVNDGRDGILVRAPSAQAVAEAIIYIVADQQRYLRMSRAAIHSVRSRFTKSRHLERLIAVLSE